MRQNSLVIRVGAAVIELVLSFVVTTTTRLLLKRALDAIVGVTDGQPIADDRTIALKPGKRFQKEKMVRTSFEIFQNRFKCSAILFF